LEADVAKKTKAAKRRAAKRGAATGAATAEAVSAKEKSTPVANERYVEPDEVFKIWANDRST
jgi:hypothetical protein